MILVYYLHSYFIYRVCRLHFSRFFLVSHSKINIWRNSEKNCGWTPQGSQGLSKAKALLNTCYFSKRDAVDPLVENPAPKYSTTSVIYTFLDMVFILSTFHRISPLGQFGLVVAMSIYIYIFICPLPMQFSKGSKGGPRGTKLCIKQQVML